MLNRGGPRVSYVALIRSIYWCEAKVNNCFLGFPEIGTECVWVAPLVAICVPANILKGLVGYNM